MGHRLWGREAAGDRFDGIELNNPVLLLAITDDPEGAATQFLKRWGSLAEGVSPAEVLDSPHVIADSVDKVMDDLQMRRERFGLFYISILGGTPYPDAFAPVIARLAGR